MSLRDRLNRSADTNAGKKFFEIFGVEGNPFPAAAQPSGHPRLEDAIDDEFVNRVRNFETEGRPSQVLLIEGTQGVGKTNLLNYYEQQFREYYEEDEAFYIIRYYPDPEPSFDSVVRRIFQGLDHKHFERMGRALSEAETEERDSAKEIARSHDVRIVLNSLEEAGDDPQRLSDYARLALEWFGGLRLLKKHRESLGVDYRLDTVESRTQALRDIVYVSERLGLLKGILLLLDELEKQDYSLSKTPVLRFLLAIRALIDVLPSNLFLVLAMTPQARLRYFAMMPALASRLQDILELKPIKEYEQAKKLYNFYVESARKSAREKARVEDAGRMSRQGMQDIFSEEQLLEIFVEAESRSSERGTEGITPRDFLHRLHEAWSKKFASSDGVGTKFRHMPSLP